MNPTILHVLPTLVGVLFLGYWVVMNHAANAPVAWEDEHGFHFDDRAGAQRGTQPRGPDREDH